MKYFSAVANFQFPWDQVTAAYWLRYPNPHRYGSHTTLWCVHTDRHRLWLSTQILMDTMILCKSVHTAPIPTPALISIGYCTQFVGLGQCEWTISEKCFHNKGQWRRYIETRAFKEFHTNYLIFVLVWNLQPRVIKIKNNNLLQNVLFSKHVLSEDTVARSFSEKDLYSVRFITKTNKVCIKQISMIAFLSKCRFIMAL